MSKSNSPQAALDRVADALFQQATVMKRQVKVQEAQLAVQEQMAQMQATNLAVTRQLEQALIMQGHSDGPKQ